MLDPGLEKEKQIVDNFLAEHKPSERVQMMIDHKSCNCHECTQTRWKGSLQRQLATALESLAEARAELAVPSPQPNIIVGVDWAVPGSEQTYWNCPTCGVTIQPCKHVAVPADGGTAQKWHVVAENSDGTFMIAPGPEAPLEDIPATVQDMEESLRKHQEDWAQAHPELVAAASAKGTGEGSGVNAAKSVVAPAQTFEESSETQVTQNYTAWASHITEEYQRGLKDGRRSVVGELREWSLKTRDAAANAKNPVGIKADVNNAEHFATLGYISALAHVAAKCDDLMNEKT